MIHRSLMRRHVGITKKMTSNGCGSFINEVVVRVDTEHVETFSDAFGVEPFRVLEGCADFSIQLKSARKSDDETMMYEIDYRLPDLPSFKGWSVLWGENSY